jgi:hypothetical protein
VGFSHFKPILVVNDWQIEKNLQAVDFFSSAVKSRRKLSTPANLTYILIFSAFSYFLCFWQFSQILVNLVFFQKVGKSMDFLKSWQFEAIP